MCMTDGSLGWNPYTGRGSFCLIVNSKATQQALVIAELQKDEANAGIY